MLLRCPLRGAVTQDFSHNYIPFLEELLDLDQVCASGLRLTCTAKGQVIPGGGAELHAADVSFGLDASHRVVQVGGP